ncbi:MAG: hypothetical protein LW832_09490 [Parachlamydia sp.]|jgi:hypothetical protein|nr:hypothetical protein [Parachlamydia sp.]
MVLFLGNGITYTIAAINGDHQEWGLERIKNFQVDQIPGCWTGDDVKWKEILDHFKVKKAEVIIPHWANEP